MWLKQCQGDILKQTVISGKEKWDIPEDEKGAKLHKV